MLPTLKYFNSGPRRVVGLPLQYHSVCYTKHKWVLFVSRQNPLKTYTITRCHIVRQRQKSQNCIRMRERHKTYNISAASHLPADSMRIPLTTNAMPRVLPSHPQWHSSEASVLSANWARWLYFRFLTGESSAFFSPAGVTGAFS